MTVRVVLGLSFNLWTAVVHLVVVVWVVPLIDLVALAMNELRCFWALTILVDLSLSHVCVMAPGVSFNLVVSRCIAGSWRPVGSVVELCNVPIRVMSRLQIGAGRDGLMVTMSCLGFVDFVVLGFVRFVLLI